jgi:hypothetical protein
VKYSIKMKRGGLISDMLMEADTRMSCADVDGLTLSFKESFLYCTSTLRSPALTAETGASIPGKIAAVLALARSSDGLILTFSFGREIFIASLNDFRFGSLCEWRRPALSAWYRLSGTR